MKNDNNGIYLLISRITLLLMYAAAICLVLGAGWIVQQSIALKTEADKQNNMLSKLKNEAIVISPGDIIKGKDNVYHVVLKKTKSGILLGIISNNITEMNTVDLLKKTEMIDSIIKNKDIKKGDLNKLK